MVVALIGSRADQWDSYPATLAALGDAADALGLALRVRYVSPQRLEPTLKALDEVDGVLLPGGSAMANVAGQIAVARDTLLRGIPTLELCLGMQTMATAALQQLASLRAASLAEADPAAPVKTFVPLCQPALTGVHRSGRLSLHSQPGTLMAALLGESRPLHYNHSYQFNPLLNEALTQTGIRVSALGGEGTVVDAIEASDGRFWCGVQGHPELGSRQDAPHPLVTALLRRAAGEE